MVLLLLFIIGLLISLFIFKSGWELAMWGVFTFSIFILIGLVGLIPFSTYVPTKNFKYIKDSKSLIILADGVGTVYSDVETYQAIDKAKIVYIKTTIHLLSTDKEYKVVLDQ